MLASPFAPRTFRILQIIGALLGIAWLTHIAYTYRTELREHIVPPSPILTDPNRGRHPIDDLRQQAQADFSLLLSRQSYTIEDAERAYIERRGRRPPPGFEDWFRFAQDHDGIIVEDFFDRAYHDLNPFWAVPPVDIRRMAHDWNFVLNVRNNAVQIKTDQEREWLTQWADLVGQVSKYLPDIDIPINEMDESRVVVPWEIINGYMAKEAASRRVVEPERLRTQHSDLVIKAEQLAPYEHKFRRDGPYWDIYSKGCHPLSLARDGYASETDFTRPPPLPHNKPARSFEGFVKNWTIATSPCDNPTLQALHGTFVEPISISTTDQLVPMFGGSKLPANNEILIPPAMYWSADPNYSGGEWHGGAWDKKTNAFVWRGVASGGRNRESNWIRFQRHRFVTMVNHTSVARAEANTSPPPNMRLPDRDAYNLSFDAKYPLSAWLEERGDAGFLDLLCFPSPTEDHPTCPYADPWFHTVESMPMKEMYNFKYLPDVDGNSFSGRYRGFLGSTSAPIKATVYAEWHDSRLVPWVHFVPMDNTFVDLYGILEYFIGTPRRAGHDDVGKAIAGAGKSWAEKVLRREDMIIYVFRVLLEYARLCDDYRDDLGWMSAP